MSLKAMVWAWEKNISATQKLVLLAVADHSDMDAKCWPSQTRLAQRCNLSRGTINRTLGELEALGLLRQQRDTHASGADKASTYRLVGVTEDYTPPVSEKDRGVSPTMTGGVSEDDTLNLPLNHPEELSKPDHDFGLWYAAYPRHESRGQAERAFARARKDGTDLPTLVSGAKAYAAAVEGTERQFIKQPATWLNGKCWLDERQGRRPADEVF